MVFPPDTITVPWYRHSTVFSAPDYDITWSSIALVCLYISTTLFLGHVCVSCVCVCVCTLSQQWPFWCRRRAEQLIMFVWFFIFVKPTPPPPPPPLRASLFVSTDSRLALNIHGGCQPLAHTKAGPGPRGLGQGGWRNRAHAERDSQACAFVYVCERERPFPLPSSASPSGIREQQWKGKREGQKDRSVLWSMRAHTHLSSAGAQGDAQASSLPSLPETHVAYWVLELSWEFNAFTHTHTYVWTHTADFKKVILTHSSQLLAMQATLRGRILARYCRLPWSTI